TALVAFTGPRTEIGKLGLALRDIGLENTNLERETRSLVRLFATVSVTLCVVVAVVYGLTRGSWLNGVLAALALAISLVPEEFPSSSQSSWRLVHGVYRESVCSPGESQR